MLNLLYKCCFMIELFFFYINININKLNNIFYLNYYFI